MNWKHFTRWGKIREFPFKKMKDMGLIEEVPQGMLYASPMPFSPFDDETKQILDQYIEAGVSKVIVLTERREPLERTGVDLFRIYQKVGMEVENFPIKDHQAPDDGTLEQFADMVLKTKEDILKGKKIAAHCFAGMGRTGLFLSAMAIAFGKMKPDEAVKFVVENTGSKPDGTAQEVYLYSLYKVLSEKTRFQEGKS